MNYLDPSEHVQPAKKLARGDVRGAITHYFGPSRSQAKLAHNPWSKLKQTDIEKLEQTGECKRMVGCMKKIGPVLENAVHLVMVEEWWVRMIWRGQMLLVGLLLLAMLGGTGLVYKVATASSYSEAFDDVFSTARGKVSKAQKEKLGGRFPTIMIPDYPDPGKPRWLDANPAPSTTAAEARQLPTIDAFNSTLSSYIFGSHTVRPIIGG